jgi:solute carrier family 25 (mitochondrial citrate transporter), member 1
MSRPLPNPPTAEHRPLIAGAAETLPRPPTEHRHPLIAGSLAGAAETLCTYPFEYIKTQLQIVGPWTSKPKYSGSLDVVRKTVECHGARGMYRGLPPYLYFAFPRCAIRFWAFEEAVTVLKRVRGVEGEDVRGGAASTSSSTSSPPAGRRLPPALAFTAGLISGVVEALVIIIPSTTLQVKFIADLNRDPEPPRYKGFVHGVRSIVTEEGWSGVYRGASPTLLKIALNMSFRFLIYNELTDSLERRWAAGVSTAAIPAAAEAWRTTAISLAAGAIAGAVTVVGNHPVDVVKSNMQAQVVRPGAVAAAAGAAGVVFYTSSLQCFRGIYSRHGLRGLYAGLIPRLNRVVLETSLTFTFYEHLSQAANKVLDGRP